MLDRSASITLTSQDLRYLKSRVHQLRPAIVLTHSRLDAWTFNSIDTALESDELIKIRTHISNSLELKKVAQHICDSLNATLIQTIGFNIAIYRKNPRELEELTTLGYSEDFTRP